MIRYHRNTLSASSSARATADRVTIMTPLNIELTKVMHTTVTRTIAVVPFPGVSRCSAEKALGRPLMVCRSSVTKGVSLPYALLEGLTARAESDVSGSLINGERQRERNDLNGLLSSSGSSTYGRRMPNPARCAEMARSVRHQTLVYTVVSRLVPRRLFRSLNNLPRLEA
jgi:hypothetical protein